MANNVHAPSLSPPFENGSISNSSTSFSTLYKDSAVVAGFNSGHLSFANINSSDKLSPLLPRPSPPPPPPPSLPPSPFLAVPFAKRPRGRPSGSKKKPEPTMEFPVPSTFISGERGDFLKPIVLIVPAGMDIVNAIINFGRDRDVSISVHHASGTISEVKLSNPLSPSDDLSLRENLHMVSFSGFYTNSFSSSPPKNIPYSFFTIQLSRGKPPQLFGGLAGGKLIAAEPVKVMASIIKKHEYHKIPLPAAPHDQLGGGLHDVTVMKDIRDYRFSSPSGSILMDARGLAWGS
ncbi:AT-hook motif nuclear-localized protein 17 [Spatholobus suberectus]|nr:AT-hook motif nuclear-localized protein 17 [Spatholobus suberectus]